MNNYLLEKLLHEEEGATLDFKRDQYRFEGTDNKTKSELLKDILAFANAWRRTTAYILIGVDEVKGSRSDVIGVKTHLDDAKLHQFVNSKTQRPIEFSYQPFRTEGVEIGVIEIPIQERPIYLKKQFGKLENNVVYKRDGSSTAMATPDEVVQMGADQNFEDAPQLVLEWADIENHTVLPSPHIVKTLILEPLLPDDTFGISPPSHFFLPHLANKNYSKEIIRYTRDMAFLRAFGLRLSNHSGVVGKRIRFIGSVTQDNTIIVLDRTNPPTRPYRNSMGGTLADIVPLAQQLQSNPDPCVQKIADGWKVTIEFGYIRPRDEVWTTSELFIGSSGGITELKGELRGDNISEPVPCVLKINFKVKQRSMEREDIEPYLDHPED